MVGQEDPWYALRPPYSDPPTYLTFIEGNLTKDKLSTLLDVLQDTELTEAIGWDLVHILVPFLPESETCLLHLARQGNPREVVLKVAESVRDIRFAPEDDEDEEQEEQEKSKKALDDAELPAPVLEFQVLLRMLAILHPRIKAKYPSRFLSTTLQAIVAAHSNVTIYHEDLADAVVKFVKTMTGTKRPHFPPRRSTSAMLVARNLDTEPDREAQPDDSPSTEEDKIHARLLQSFVTHILEDYLQSLRSEEDTPGLAWSSRYLEKAQHPYLNPNKTPLTEQFTKVEKLESRLTTVGQLVALAQDLEIHSDELLAATMDPSPEPEGERDEEDTHPKSAEDVPFSKTGSLYLFTARKAMESLYDGPSITSAVKIFPEHATLVRNFIGSPSDTGILSLEPEPLIDALLFLGLVALDNDAIGEPENDEVFAEYLQSLSLISSLSSSPSLRYHAHYLTSTILRSHPNDKIRFIFIRDTLAHAPFENLKASAVGWMKGETLEANQSQPTAPDPQHNSPVSNTPKAATADPDPPSLFATDIPLHSLTSLLFPDLSSAYDLKASDTDIAESYAQFRASYGFYLAALNFYYLLLLCTHMHETLHIKTLTVDGEIQKQFVRPLQQAAQEFASMMASSGPLSAELGGEVDSSILNELEVMGMVAKRVEEEIGKLGF